MKNFDYLKDIDALQTLYTFCNTAETLLASRMDYYFN